jgi:ubiquinone/menaquinone biosynthesis C-methylase UbiE
LRPPRHLSFVGRGDFEQTGREFAGHFVELGGLTPGSDVLDIGSGIGRMAIPLTSYLEDGSYAGFDVGKEMIRWCQRQITPRNPNFAFAWAPVYNQKYNPFGELSGADFRFPYQDDSFDFAFATSLFTHLVPEEVSHYLAETARVLRPGGTCFLTFFVLTDQARREMGDGKAAFDFCHSIDGAMTVARHQPEEAIAYEVEDLSRMFAEAGLAIRDPIHLGAWSNSPNAVTGQDVIIATSRSDTA